MPSARPQNQFRGDADFLQLRDKSSSSSGGAARLALADAICARVHARGGRLIVNDRPDIARMCGADGVHVGQDDMSVADARRVVGDDAIVGVSTHDEAQVAAAVKTTATYVAVGPIYGTATKDTGYTARGLALVRHGATTADRPVVAIGGITLERAPEVIAAGAASVAVISDLLRGDPIERVRQFLRQLETAGRPRVV